MRKERRELSMASCAWQRVDTMSSSSAWRVSVRQSAGGGCSARTIPELLLILEVVRHLKCHVGVAGRVLQSSSPATKATRTCRGRRKPVVAVSSFATSLRSERQGLPAQVRHRFYFGRDHPLQQESSLNMICHQFLDSDGSLILRPPR